jgi:hypothetical protein
LNINSGNKKRVFISHAVGDKDVVKAFVNLLESGIGVSSREIFCVSVSGQGIKPGQDFKNSIHQNLDEASTVIALISENFYSSAFCMCELGGVWLQAKDFIPILVPPVSFGEMKAVLAGLQALKIEDAVSLDQLRDEVAERLGIQPLATPRWNEKRDEFLRMLPSQLAALPPAQLVERKKFEKAEKERSEYEVSLKVANAEIQRLNKVVVELVKVKDAVVTAGILRAELPLVDIFEKIVEAARKPLGALEKVTKEALFQHYKGGIVQLSDPSRFNWDDANQAIEYKELKLNEAEGGIVLDLNSPKVKKALGALDELNRWLTNDSADSSFFEWYAKENDDLQPELSNRSFWEKHF